METPNIGPISPHFGPRRAARERRESRDRRRAFDEFVPSEADGAADSDADGETDDAKPADLQQPDRKRRKDGQDGGNHVDVLA